ncbi:PHP domain-containing protein [Subtercola boreus]|uniref:Phosphatase n=1 Tax=Subtercola boreus TaxID=120213 RepID=A0A3E0W9I8_9MICO|nr:PHP domain-containing protein [Subtercola boreus]RFA19973.1 phosphatase [Subtercola boreus]RFA20102.1 phosphatase [Subtercola boreus]RFA26429.1 phosphatase [Subtercola boreus]
MSEAAPLFRGSIDLHTHSSASDGTETPYNVVRSASEAGLGTLAITDHDSTAGWPTASEAARDYELTLIPGMELSTRLDHVSVHLLSYLFDPTNAALLAETETIRDARLTRARQIVERIGVDYDLTWADVVAQTRPGATVGRPHIADALVAKGFTPTRSDAFQGILHWRAGYFQPHYAPTPLRGVELVVAAGGVPVLAHPGTGSRERVMPERRLAELVDAGLFGLEIEHRQNTVEGKERLHELAAKFGLAITGSSDYHGEGKPNRLGENTTSPAVLERLIDRASGWAPVYGAVTRSL